MTWQSSVSVHFLLICEEYAGVGDIGTKALSDSLIQSHALATLTLGKFLR